MAGSRVVKMRFRLGYTTLQVWQLGRGAYAQQKTVQQRLVCFRDGIFLTKAQSQATAAPA